MIDGRKLLAVAAVLLTVSCLGSGQANTNTSNPAPGTTGNVSTGTSDAAGQEGGSVAAPDPTQQPTGSPPQSPASSPATVTPQGEPSAAAPLRVLVGKSLLINTTERLKRVAVTDPSVADAQPITPTQILVHGRSP
jgi:Flp pilus assembly secretin CpaC